MTEQPNNQSFNGGDQLPPDVDPRKGQNFFRRPVVLVVAGAALLATIAIGRSYLSDNESEPSAQNPVVTPTSTPSPEAEEHYQTSADGFNLDCVVKDKRIKIYKTVSDTVKKYHKSPEIKEHFTLIVNATVKLNKERKVFKNERSASKNTQLFIFTSCNIISNEQQPESTPSE